MYTLNQEVVVVTRTGQDRVGKVVKLTKTQMVVQVGKSQFRFVQATGNEVGGSIWSGSSVYAGTPEQLAKVKAAWVRSVRVATLRQVRWENQTDEVLDQVLALLP